MIHKDTIIEHSKPFIDEFDIKSINDSLISGMVASGKRVNEFEYAISHYVDKKYSIACGSGTAALIIGLLALDIKTGDEIILPTYVCHSVSDAITSIGAKPVFADIGKNWVITPETVEKCITDKTKGIIIVNIFGISATDKKFVEFNLPLIEDSCQSFGLKYINEIDTAFSFYSFNATKCLCTGEGGALVSNNISLINRSKNIINSNRIPSVMSDIQASLGLSQLLKYKKMLEDRKKIAHKYFVELPENLTSNIFSLKDDTMFFRFPLIYRGSKSFEQIKNEFAENKIAVRKGVDNLLHRNFKKQDKYFTNAVKAYNETISIPIYPALTEEEIDYIILKTKEILG